jgi:hypothetical protein
MSPLPSPGARELLTSYYRSGDALRSRSVGAALLTATLDVPAPPARLTADWQRECSAQLGLEPGDVEALSLARTRMRWPALRDCVQAMADWTRALGLQELLATSDIALMACRGARYHHDGAQYGGAAFGNLFLSEDRGLDLHFPVTGRRIPLRRGTSVVFDTGQPHAVIQRHASGFRAGDFAPALDCTQVFLTWELPIEDGLLSQALGIAFDVDPAGARQLEVEQVRLQGEAATLCPDSGCWQRPA